MKIVNNLIEDIDFIESPNHGGQFKTGDLSYLIIHYTAGSSAESSIKTLTDPNVKASAHVVVARDGNITQLVPFNIIAWHAGKSSHLDKDGLNKYSIGIEIDNAGKLDKQGNEYVSWFGRAYPESEVMQATHRNQTVPAFWHTYTEVQISRVEELSRLLISGFNLNYILGHEEISPGRKIDPGPAFPLDKFRERLLNSGRDTDEEADLEGVTGTVQASKLNIRSGPDINADKIARPLERGAKVEILDQRAGWLKVSSKITGWVSERFVDT